MPEVANSSKFIEILKDNGVLPPNCYSAQIIADVGEPIRGFFYTYPDHTDVALAAVMGHIEFVHVEEMVKYCREFEQMVRETSPTTNENVQGEGREYYPLTTTLVEDISAKLSTMAAWMDWANNELGRNALAMRNTELRNLTDSERLERVIQERDYYRAREADLAAQLREALEELNGRPKDWSEE